MRFCADCARDVAACKKDSEQNGWKELYEDQAKADDTFVFMILQYQERCSGKGRGFSRNKFDHLSFREKVYCKKNVRRGTREVMMDWGEFVAHFEKKGYAGTDILAKWNELLQAGAETDQKGRKGQELRISTEVETYKLDEVEHGAEKSRELSHSHGKKFKDDDVDFLGEELARNPDARGQPSSGVLPSVAGSAGHAEAKDKEKEKGKASKQTPFARRTQMHDATVQAVRKCQDVLKKIPEKIRETLVKFKAEEAEYEEYVRILEAREKLCKQLAAHMDLKSREEVEQASVSTSSNLENFLASLNDIEKSYLPDQGKNLRTIPSCLHMTGLLLRKSTRQEIDDWKRLWDDIQSGLVQITALMEQSIKDIEQAKRLRDKKRARDQEAERKRQEREAVKKVKQEQRAALKAGAKKLAAPAAAGAGSLGPQRPVLGIPAEKLQKVAVLAESAFANMSSAERLRLAQMPLLIKDCVKAMEAVRSDARVKAQLAMFQVQFAVSSQSKTTGRVQLPLNQPEHVKSLTAVMAGLDPCGTQWGLNLPGGHGLSPFDQPYIYGSTSEARISGQAKFAFRPSVRGS